MKKAILVISTLNTKRQETLYLKDKIKACGLQPLLMDISMRGTQASPADIEQLPDRRWILAQKDKNLALCLASFHFPAFDRLKSYLCHNKPP